MFQGFEQVDVKVEWSVINMTRIRHVTYYSCCTEPYIDVDFSITVERRSAAYRPIVLIPAISESPPCLLTTLPSLGEKQTNSCLSLEF